MGCDIGYTEGRGMREKKCGGWGESILNINMTKVFSHCNIFTLRTKQ